MSLLLLVDGHAYAYRAFHAIRSLNGPDGKPTNAIFGFVKMLQRMLAEVSPSHVAVIWDGGLSAERMALLPEYKAQRPAMPESLSQQIGEVMTYLSAAKIFSTQQDGVEADDLIASLTRSAADQGVRVVIASADKDFFQLITDSVGLLNPNDKTGKIWAAGDVVAKTGVRPEQIVDWLSLVGDAVDNVAGVAGVGPKTAASILAQFGSVDAVYDRIDDVEPDRIRESLRAAKGNVRRNQQMIRLKSDLMEIPPLGELACVKPEMQQLLKLYQHWGFRGMAAEAASQLAEQGDLFSAAKS
ncbi:MAG: hypothetical protein RLY20_2922 [Verrucomicrobiota bacterium]|jgi:DNA polymerase-1